MNWLEMRFLLPYINSMLRKLLTIVGTYLMTKGVSDSEAVGPWVDTSAQILTGLITIVISQGWSFLAVSKREG